jgi:hypothetical protein
MHYNVVRTSLSITLWNTIGAFLYSITIPSMYLVLKLNSVASFLQVYHRKSSRSAIVLMILLVSGSLYVSFSTESFSLTSSLGFLTTFIGFLHREPGGLIIPLCFKHPPIHSQSSSWILWDHLTHFLQHFPFFTSQNFIFPVPSLITAGNRLSGLSGVSLLPPFSGQQKIPQDTLYMSHLIHPSDFLHALSCVAFYFVTSKTPNPATFFRSTPNSPWIALLVISVSSLRGRDPTFLSSTS